MEEHLRRKKVDWPELSELDAVRHFTQLSSLNFHIEKGMYPLGSCTMKYNPKVNEATARLPGFAALHPRVAVEDCQGALQLYAELERLLADLTGMAATSLQPAAGAHGELTSLMCIAAYFRSRGETRTKVLTPDSAHGTNPASAALVNFQVVELPSDKRGMLAPETLEAALADDVAALMLTNPNTLGIFEADILKLTELCHQRGVQVYCDGANMNALVGQARPGDMGFDVMHLNLHKTFSTPHGGGGPGAGPICVAAHLEPFLPNPRVEKTMDGTWNWVAQREQAIGSIHGWYGNFGVLVRAYTYLLACGLEGLQGISQDAVLSANYLRKKLSRFMTIGVDQPCMHEAVFTGDPLADKTGVTTMDLAKRLLDLGFHAPTVYFPLVVHQALMIEPTESESRETLDKFVAAMEQIHREAKEDPEKVKGAPHSTVIGRPDEAMAARKPILTYSMGRR
jgi:glycine dehydrogenase subunit 2